jgi:alanine racemase
MAVVKANAYGHGAVETSRALIRHGVTRLAVFSTQEGVDLRQAGIPVPIVVLGPIFPAQFDDLFAHRLIPVVSDPSVLTELAQAAASREVRYPIHLKVETGMGRLGLTEDELLTLMRSHRFPSSLRLEGLMTHLADADGSNPDASEDQIRRCNSAW